MTGAQIERARAKERLLKLSKLSKEDYREWKRMLAAVSLRRDSIKKTMGFAFDKIESAEEVRSLCLLTVSTNHIFLRGLWANCRHRRWIR
jgi:hypothetical protein